MSSCFGGIDVVAKGLMVKNESQNIKFELKRRYNFIDESKALKGSFI